MVSTWVAAVGVERDFAGAERLVSVPGDQQHLAAGVASLVKW